MFLAHAQQAAQLFGDREALRAAKRGGYALYRRDSSPVRFLFRAPEKVCGDLEIPAFCE